MCVPTPLSCPTPLLWIHFVSVRASILFYSHRNHPIMESTLPAYQFYANLLTKYSSTIKGTCGGKLKAKQPHHWLFDCRELIGKRFSWRAAQLHKAARTVHPASFQNVNCNWKDNVCKFLWPRLFFTQDQKSCRYLTPGSALLIFLITNRRFIKKRKLKRKEVYWTLI